MVPTFGLDLVVLNVEGLLLVVFELVALVVVVLAFVAFWAEVVDAGERFFAFSVVH